MTDAPHPQDHEAQEYDAAHEGPIKTPRQFVKAFIWAHVVPIGGILLLVAFVVSQVRPPAGSDALTPEAVARRIAPVGHVDIRDVSDVSSMKTGEQVFAGQCTACHTSGVAGAPKLGDKAAWAPRIATGYDTLLHAALKGKGAMPPQGGADFGDVEIARAVVYMANKAGAHFEEPKVAPAPATTAEAPPTGDAAAAAAVAAAQAAMKNVESAKAEAPAGAAHAGGVPKLFAQVCSACHSTGAAGAPKLGDKAAWADRLPLGIDGLTAVAIKGKGAMPPRGGSTASDAEIKEVVTYMVNAVK